MARAGSLVATSGAFAPGARDLEAFIRLPESLYRNDPTFIPMLRSSERKMLDPAPNPFYRHAEAAHFLARRDGRVVVGSTMELVGFRKEVTAAGLGSLLALACRTVPALALTTATFAVYLAGVALIAEPGAFRALLLPASLGVAFLLGPLLSLAALQLAVCVSSRVNDARSAQQIGALVVLPLTAAFILQITGMLRLTPPMLGAAALVLVGVNIALMLLGIRRFDRESILTRWK